MYDGMNLYRAVVAYSSPVTGDITVRIPSILGEFAVLPVSKIGREAIDGTWQVPLIGSQTVVAVEDDRFSHVYMVYPNLAVISASSGGGGEEPTTGVPTGSIMQYAGATTPDGWLFCRGQSLSKTGTYANLFAAIGYAYGGSGDTFLLPNLQGRVPVGLDPADVTFSTLDNRDGSKAHTLSTTEIPSHTHGGTTANGGGHNHTSVSAGTHSHSSTGSSTDSAGSHGHSTDSTGSHSHTVSVYQYSSTGAGPPSTGARISGQGLYPTVVGTSESGNASGSHSHTAASAGSHSHTISLSIGNAGSHSHTIDAAAAHTHDFTTGSTGGGGAHNNLQPYIVVNYIIKV